MKRVFVIVAVVAPVLTGLAVYQYVSASNSDEVQLLESRIEQLESDLAIERYSSSAAIREAAKGVSMEEYEKVVNQYNELVAKYNSLASTPTYTPSYSPIYCTSNSYSFTNTTYTNCY